MLVEGIDKSYIEKLDASDIRWFEYECNRLHYLKDVLDSLLHDLDCTRVYKDGSRPMQTINYGYRRNIAGFLYIIEKHKDRDAELIDSYIKKLVARHEENISFESEHGTIDYSKKSKASSRNRTRTSRSTDMFTGETIDVGTGVAKVVKPKENSATRKAKALASKSVSFAFNNFKVNGNNDK